MQVDAPSEAEARVRAERELFDRSAQSSVGWVPEVVSARISAEGSVGVGVATPPAPEVPVLGPEPRVRVVRFESLLPAKASHPHPYPLPPAGEGVQFHRAFDGATAVRELVGLAQDLGTLATSDGYSEWIRGEAVELARDAMALARRIDPEAAAVPPPAGSATSLDVSGHRVGAALAALIDFKSRSSEAFRQSEALATRLAVFLHRLSAEEKPVGWS